MGLFTGQLKSNVIFSTNFNMIISQQVFADNIAGATSPLVEDARVDGTLYGDTKLYYATDILGSNVWGNDAEAKNLLDTDRPMDPDIQAITLDQFRQISVTLDNYLTKQAYKDEGAFAQFTSVVSGAVALTKKIYDEKLYNTFIGTTKSEEAAQNISVTVNTATEAQDIAFALSDLTVNLSDASRIYNDYHNYRSYDPSMLKIVWNANYVNKIKNIDLPTIFHNEELVKHFSKYVLPAKYFGNVVVGGTADGKTHRSLIEKDFNEKGIKRDDPRYDRELHIFPGDLIPTGKTFGTNEAYVADDKVICKVMIKLPPFMSAMEVATSFFNPKSLTENRYLTWGYNDLEYLKNYPMITVKKAA